MADGDSIVVEDAREDFLAEGSIVFLIGGVELGNRGCGCEKFEGNVLVGLRGGR